MSDEIIRINSSSFSRYEELLLERDEFRKQAYQYGRAYTREFGDLTLKVFQAKLESIRKKKAIEFCQKYVNKGENIKGNKLDEFLKMELLFEESMLEFMILDNEDAKRGRLISEADLYKIKKIYHGLVKKIHPDINPLTEQSEELSDLWQRLIIAYSCNDLKEMEELEVIINALFKKLDLGDIDVTITDIEEKILEIENEIEKIKITEPYQYKFFLNDSEAVLRKKKELGKELKEYEDYCRNLEEILDQLLKSGVIIEWKMN